VVGGEAGAAAQAVAPVAAPLGWGGTVSIDSELTIP
jgi:hypothetical protein